MDGTVRENILFGETFDSNRYFEAIRAAHLNADIAKLAEQDGTDVSTAGLSAITRQKIGIARAVYAKRDINLMDEPLAELSYSEAVEVFDNVLDEMTGSTVIVASDRLEVHLYLIFT